MPSKGSTTQRGLGYSHQQRAKRAKAAMPDGTPCPYCGKPMYRWQRLHYDHITPRILGGSDGPCRIAHGSCNERAGSRLGNRLRSVKRTRRTPYTRW